MRAIKSLSLEDRRRGEWDTRVADNMRARYRWGTLANYPQTFVIPFNRAMYSGSIVIGAAIALANPSLARPAPSSPSACWRDAPRSRWCSWRSSCPTSGR